MPTPTSPPQFTPSPLPLPQQVFLRPIQPPNLPKPLLPERPPLNTTLLLTPPHQNTTIIASNPPPHNHLPVVITPPLLSNPPRRSASFQTPLASSTDVHARPPHLPNIIGWDFETSAEGPVRVVAHSCEISLWCLDVGVESAEIEGRECIGVGVFLDLLGPG